MNTPFGFQISDIVTINFSKWRPALVIKRTTIGWPGIGRRCYQGICFKGLGLDAGAGDSATLAALGADSTSA